MTMNIEKVITQKIMKNSCKIRYDVNLSQSSKDLIVRNGFLLDAVSNIVSSATVYYPNIAITGIGLKNNKGGFLFYSDKLTVKPFFLLNNEPVYLPYREKHRSRTCCVFFDMFDYLSYLTILHDKEYKNDFPCNCDCIIMGEIKNFVSVMLETESYEVTYCFLPNTLTGRTMAMTFKSRNPNNFDDLSGLYNGFDTLHEFSLDNNNYKKSICSGL